MNIYWSGNASLKNTMVVSVLGSVVIPIIIALVVFLFGVTVNYPSYLLAFTSFLFLILFNPYYVFCWVSLWRNSNNTDTQINKFIARLFVIAHVILVFIALTQALGSAQKYL